LSVTPDSWGFSLFCDDIRFEMGAKMSVMGIYQTDLIVPPGVELPFVIAKFGILIKYYERKDAFKDDIVLRVFLPGDATDAPTVAVPLPRAGLGSTVPPLYPLDEDQERVFSLTFPIVLSPMTVKQEGFVKVRAVCGDVTTKLGSLMLRKARSDEVVQFPGLPPVPPLSPPPPPAISG
jgi:hypothetical protein